MATKTLGDLVQDFLGVKTFHRDNPVTATVGLASQTLLRQNPNRVAFLVVNLSPNNVHIGPFGDVSSSKGILASPSGGNIVAHYREDFDIVGLEWFGIANVAGSAVLVIEWLTQREP